MPRKYEVIDELIRDEIREFLLWLEMKKKIELCSESIDWGNLQMRTYSRIHKAPEDLINEYMEIK